jgi:hypothetical protein
VLSGTIVGPYARCITEWKLKFWFALVVGKGLKPIRYEVTVDRLNRKHAFRRRAYFDSPGAHRTNFSRYLLPDDLSMFPSVAFPRFKGDDFIRAAISLLDGDDIADVTRVRLVGLLPELPP